jgi:sugar-specific transcriptional regulator TrmB
MKFDVLKKMGLSDNEIQIYTTLLRSSEASAYELSQKTGIYRPHVYDKLETLLARGLISYIQKGKKKIFQAHRPAKLLEYLEEKHNELAELKKELQNAMPNLISLTQRGEQGTRVEVFEGKEGLKVFLTDIINTKKDVCLFGLDDTKYDETLPVFMPQYFKNLRLNKIKERVISLKKKGILIFDNYSTTYRFLESEYLNPTNTFVYGDKTAIVIWQMPISVIMIKNQQLAETYAEHFEKLWKVADKSCKGKIIKKVTK